MSKQSQTEQSKAIITPETKTVKEHVALLVNTEDTQVAAVYFATRCRIGFIMKVNISFSVAATVRAE